MKTISFSRVANVLSDSEMKHVKGGGERKPNVKEAPDPCSGLKYGDKCSLGITGGGTGSCAHVYENGAYKLTCK